VGLLAWQRAVHKGGFGRGQSAWREAGSDWAGAYLRRCLDERKAAADTGAKRLAGLMAGFTEKERTQREMVTELSSIRIPAPNGGRWSLIQGQRLIKRLCALRLTDNPDAGVW